MTDEDLNILAERDWLAELWGVYDENEGTLMWTDLMYLGIGVLVGIAVVMVVAVCVAAGRFDRGWDR